MGCFERAIYGTVGGKDPLMPLSGTDSIEIDGRQVRI
jgi:hypothetical protein